jgi:hypothetical protein
MRQERTFRVSAVGINEGERGERVLIFGFPRELEKIKSPAAHRGEALKACAQISDIKSDDYAGLIPLCISSMCTKANGRLFKPFI